MRSSVVQRQYNNSKQARQSPRLLRVQQGASGRVALAQDPSEQPCQSGSQPPSMSTAASCLRLCFRIFWRPASPPGLPASIQAQRTSMPATASLTAISTLVSMTVGIRQRERRPVSTRTSQWLKRYHQPCTVKTSEACTRLEWSRRDSTRQPRPYGVTIKSYHGQQLSGVHGRIGHATESIVRHAVPPISPISQVGFTELWYELAGSKHAGRSALSRRSPRSGRTAMSVVVYPSINQENVYIPKSRVSDPKL